MNMAAMTSAQKAKPAIAFCPAQALSMIGVRRLRMWLPSAPQICSIANAANNRLVASICGLNTWEMISIIHKGANYGFPYREGPEAVTPDNGTAPLRWRN